MSNPFRYHRVPRFNDCEVFVVDRNQEPSLPGAGVLFPLKQDQSHKKEVFSPVRGWNQLALTDAESTAVSLPGSNP